MTVAKNAYKIAHRKVAHMRGIASSQRCIYCRRHAAQWALNHSRATKVTDGHLVWSEAPDDYDPLCVACHRIYDQAFAKDGQDALEDVDRRLRDKGLARCLLEFTARTARWR
ncbi:hypothetical protein ACFU6I_46410 [Streptomyces sp. NPDC057486]|uniref:hypothetical protein n=1 Tax=Streptomyces sp. NPDC057486 TaxID=3346145 RepID=UPI0036AD795A